MMDRKRIEFVRSTINNSVSNDELGEGERYGWEVAQELLEALDAADSRMESLLAELRHFANEAVCPVNENLAPGFVSGAYDGWGRARNWVSSLLGKCNSEPVQ